MLPLIEALNPKICRWGSDRFLSGLLFIKSRFLSCLSFQAAPLEENVGFFFFFSLTAVNPLGGEEEAETACVFYATIKSSTNHTLALFVFQLCLLFRTPSLCSEDWVGGSLVKCHFFSIGKI